MCKPAHSCLYSYHWSSICSWWTTRASNPDSVNHFVSNALLLAQIADTGNDDYVRRWFEDLLSGLSGGPGDVGIAMIGILFAIWKKRYRAAVGCLVLICGLVILRIVISIFFGANAFG